MPGIVVGIDGSVHSRHALEWALSEAALRRRPLTVLTVTQAIAESWGPVWYPPQDIDLTAESAKAAQEEVDVALDKIGGGPRPLSVSVQSVVGLPAEEILRVAKDADMIVIGSRGAGGFRKLLMGAVSLQVTHHARCPVVVIPAEPEPAARPRLAGELMTGRYGPRAAYMQLSFHDWRRPCPTPAATVHLSCED